MFGTGIYTQQVDFLRRRRAIASTAADTVSRKMLLRGLSPYGFERKASPAKEFVTFRSLVKGRPAEVSMRNDQINWNTVNEIFVEKDYQFFETLAFTPKVVLDLGANVGVALSYIQSLWEDCQIYSFEPGDYEADQAQKNLRKPHHHLIRKAVGSIDGDVIFQINSKLGPLQSMIFPVEGALEKTLPCVTLDTFCREANIKPEVLKIDVEGAEYEVLKGASKTLESVKVIVMETHRPDIHWNCRKLLQDLDYDIRQDTHRGNFPGGEARILAAERS